MSPAPRLIDGKYRLAEPLGEGGLGVVYRAVHVGLEKSFAVKLLKSAGAPSPSALARFQREALALGRLRHPHIVEVTDAGVDEGSGVPYLVMELLGGVPLSALSPLPLAKALPFLEQIAGAIDAAHGAGVLHRDLKPGNVVVCSAQSAVKVLDFGLAELLSGPFEPAVSSRERRDGTPSLTTTGALPGTPLYAAPEVIRHGQASRASDIYSFAVIAYELLGGKPPFEGTVAEVLAAQLESEPPPLALPPQVWLALREALHKDPALRPGSAGELVRRLRQGAAEAERARWKATEIPRRLRLAALLAVPVLALGFILPWPAVPALERRIGDLRVLTSPAKAPDPRILLVTLDDTSLDDASLGDASLDGSPLSLAERGDEIGRALSRILEAGARGVAIDLQLHAQWSGSQDFSDLLLRHSAALTLAAFSHPDGTVVGTECVDALTAAALGPKRTSELFGFVNLDEDRDGVTRRGRLWFRDRSGGRRLSWAARAARGLRTVPPQAMPRAFWIDARIDWTRYARISWREVPNALARNPALFHDRLVLVGGDFRGSGDDYHRVPHLSGRSEAVSGLTLQALTVDTIGAGGPIREPARLPGLAAATLAAALAMAAVLCTRRSARIAAWLALGAGIYLALSFPVFGRTGLMLPVTTPLVLVSTGWLAAFVLRRRMTIPRLLIFGALLAPAAQAEAPRPVAVVYSLAGQASLQAPGSISRPVGLFDRLATGTTVEVGSASRISLAFLNGRRYELGEHSRVSVGAKDLSSQTGLVRPLPSGPPLPRLSPIAAEDRPGPRAGAVRVRGERITGLYPSHGAVALHEASTLRFAPVDGGRRYRVEVQDRRGNLIFDAETEASTVTVPAGILRPGTRYAWTVRTLEREGPAAQGTADFATLAAKTAEAREGLRQALTAEGDGASLALLAEVDWSLGLFAEALAELRAAALGSPGDTLLAASLAEREAALPYLQSP